MLLKSSLANQEAVQAKAAGKKKKKQPSEWARGRKKNCSVCVYESVCSFYPSSEQIFINLCTPVLGCI